MATPGHPSLQRRVQGVPRGFPESSERPSRECTGEIAGFHSQGSTAKFHSYSGTMVCGRDVLQTTHAMFTDDTTLFASSRAHMTEMIKDVPAALEEHGLNLNVDKCLVQSTHPDVCMRPIVIDGQHISMVSSTEGFKVVGTQFTLQGRCSAEVKSHMSAAWGKCHSLWPLVGKRDGNLIKSLRLVDTSVTQAALWCSESWLLTRREKHMLKTMQITQHAMLRRIAGPRRRPDEQWVECMKRSTCVAVDRARSAGNPLMADSALEE